MTRSTSTQRGASRRTTGSTARSGSTSRAAAPRARKARSSAKSTTPRRPPAAPPRPWGPALVIGIVVVLAWALYPAVRLDYLASRDRAAHQQELRRLADANAKLTKEIGDLKTPKGVEKAARESLGYAKSGEHVYVVVPPNSGEASGAAGLGVTQAELTGRTVVQVLLDAIFGVQQPTSTVEP